MAIKWHLKELMDEARLTYRSLNSESGISTEILVRLVKEEDAAASSKTIDRLLNALQHHIRRPLTTSDLQEWVWSDAELEAVVKKLEKRFEGPGAHPWEVISPTAPVATSLAAALEKQRLGLLLTVEERTMIRTANARRDA